mmetsp:Transcript_78089/g.225813  ORF Transcript_78089/g.225813 Transcript_78089/m.225813 type:complete len:224 (+) Transcript_78089:367-1038(+)
MHKSTEYRHDRLARRGRHRKLRATTPSRGGGAQRPRPKGDRRLCPQPRHSLRTARVAAPPPRGQMRRPMRAQGSHRVASSGGRRAIATMHTAHRCLPQDKAGGRAPCAPPGSATHAPPTPRYASVPTQEGIADVKRCSGHPVDKAQFARSVWLREAKRPARQQGAAARTPCRSARSTNGKRQRAQACPRKAPNEAPRSPRRRTMRRKRNTSWEKAIHRHRAHL